MIVYKYLMKIAFKYRLIILGYISIFTILSILSAGSGKKIDEEFTETRLNIGIVDNSNSRISNSFIEYLNTKNNILEINDNPDYIKEQIFLGIVDGVIIIPKDFDNRVINREESIILYKDDRKIGTYYLEQQIEKFFVFLNGIIDNGNYDLNILESALDEKVEIFMVGKTTDISDNSSWFKNYFNLGSYIIIAIYISIIGLVMNEFRNKRIEDRTKISSKKFFEYNSEIYFGLFTIGYLITLIIILGSIIMKGKYIGEVDFIKYIVNILVFSFSILCFSYLITSITRNRLAINGISTVMSLGISFISGVFVSQELLSKKALTIAKIFPSYYFVKINENNISSLLDIKNNLIIQILFGVGFLLLGLFFSKIRQ